MMRKLLLCICSLFYVLLNKNETGIKKKIHFLKLNVNNLFFTLILLCFSVNVSHSQAATSTWALTGNGNATTTGNLSASGLSTGSSLSITNFGTNGVTSSGWSNNSNNLRDNEYYEFKVAPITGYALNVTSINFQHSVSNGTWTVQAYYSTDNFLTSTAIAPSFNSTSTITNNNNSLSISGSTSPITIRIYGWKSGGNNRSLRIKNFIVTGTTSCLSAPSVTNVAFCEGGSGALSASLSGAVNTGNTGNTFSGSWNAAVDLVAKMPKGYMVLGDPCNFDATITRNYSVINFTVSTTGSYNLKMTDDANFDGMAYIYTGAFTPGSCSTGTWVVGADDDVQADREPRLIANLTAGTVYTLVSTTWATTSGTYSGNYSWTVIPPSGGQLTLSTVNWYKAPTGGNPIWNGSSFNPAGVTGSGVNSTPAPGTYSFYASSGGASCPRTLATYTVNATPTLTGIAQSASVCSGSAATINLSGLVESSTSAVSYTINGVAQPVASVVATSSGTGSFTTPVLTSVNNGQTLQITGITITSAIPNCNKTFTSNLLLSVNSLPTTSNAGADQYGNGAFILAANTPAVGTGIWSITSGPNTNTNQFSNVSSPTATFTPSGAGTYTLKWTISNSCGTSADEVDISNCIGNLIKNGDFSTGTTQYWAKATTKGSTVEILKENVYFPNNNGENYTAELDSQASLGQNVTVIPGVSYTLSFLYARRPGSSPTTALDFKIIDGSNTISHQYTTNDTTNKIMFESFPFTPTSSSIWIEFYNSVETTTLGSIIDNIVLIPSSQVNPVATTSPKGKYKTLDVCDGASVQLDVENVPASGVSYAWSSTSTGVAFSRTDIKNPKITVTGTGIKNATVVVTTAGGCSSTATTTYVNVMALPVAVLISSDTDNIFCAGTSVTFTGSGGTNYAFKVGSTTVQSGSSTTFTTSALTNGEVVTVDVTNASGCTSTSTGITNTVNPLPSAPTITKNNDVSCGSLGSITLTGLTGDWTVKQTGTTTLPKDHPGPGSSLPIQDLIAGTYNFTVTNNTTGCISDVASVTIADISSSTTWNGSGWSNGEPDGSKSVIISSVVPNQPFPDVIPLSKTNIDACSLTIEVPAGSQVIIPSGVTLTITNAVTSNGGLVFKSGSSLIQKANVPNSGDIVYERATNLRRYDVVYWSTPVTKTGFTMHDLSPKTLFDKYFYWNALGGKWVYNTNGTEPMKVGEGYNIRGPQDHDIVNPKIFTGVFTGVPNNGDIPINVVPNSWNFLGNPYPSAIDARELILVTNKDKLGSLYFWTHNQPPQIIPGTNIYRYISSDYLVFNGVGSTRVNNAASATDEFKGYIGAGQGFFAMPTTSVINFNNDLRRGSSENTQFYKTTQTKEIEKNRLWLNAANSQGAFKQMLIGYIEGATNANDVSYDAITMGSNSYVDFYSINETKKLTIQGRALPFDNTEVIPLGFKCGVDATGDRTFTISIDHADGFFNTQEVYLEDKALGIVTDLRKENYTFTSGTGTYSNRFALRYTNKTLGNDDFENLENAVLVSVKDKAVNIISSKETIKEVNIYNVGAQLVYSNSKVNASELQIKNLHSTDQVLLVKITLENGHTFTKKVVFSNL